MSNLTIIRTAVEKYTLAGSETGKREAIATLKKTQTFIV